MAKKQFKAESKRLLDLMINSIYTHKEIFLRELISNASDAIDKLYYRSLTDSSIKLSKESFEILLNVDKISRTLTITDNGCGMTKEELESNLGTIAKSGSLAFKAENEQKEDIDIIGQFGVGFYSAFMVAKKVTVLSRPYGSNVAYKWESDGADGYTITECEKEANGTTIILEIKDDTEEEKYENFLETWEIQRLVQRYSDYIRYPIKMPIEKSRKKEGSENEWEDYTVIETLNSMIPLWKKNKSELTDEDYNNFYKDKFMDYENPLKVIHTSTEGAASYNALLFIPSKMPLGYYSKDFEKGLALYSNGVMIMEKCADLLPDCFGFIRGLVDSQNLSLNISRELLQHDRQLKAISLHLEKKIKSELSALLKNDREKYESFFKSFGLSLKYGIYTSYGTNKELLQDLLLFTSSNEEKYTTLREYIDRMKEDQKYIYYACGNSVSKVAALPQTELFKEKGIEILYLTDEIDEFAIKMLRQYDDKEFKNISDSDLDTFTDEQKKDIEKKAQENKDLFEYIKTALGDKVSAVKPSAKLKTHPVCLSSEGEITLEMEKVLNAMPTEEKVKAKRVLEINTEHPVFGVLTKLFESDKEKLSLYANLLYNQALLIEGMTIEDPLQFSNDICKLMA